MENGQESGYLGDITAHDNFATSGYRGIIKRLIYRFQSNYIESRRRWIFPSIPALASVSFQSQLTAINLIRNWFATRHAREWERTNVTATGRLSYFARALFFNLIDAYD